MTGLATSWLGRHYQHLAEVDSTNDYLKERADSLPHGAVVTADLQTKGRGRRGKSWVALPGQSLAMTALLHHWKLEEMGRLPLIAGLAVAEGLEQLCGISCQIKWSNDVLLGGQKLCGILCESRIARHQGFAVVGIGINLRQQQQELHDLGLVYAVSLFSVTGKYFGAEDVAAAVLNQLELLLEQYSAEGFGPILALYRRRCVTLGQTVRVLWEDREQLGTALDIGEDGSLLCNIDGKVRSVVAGEASVRGIYGYSGL